MALILGPPPMGAPIEDYVWKRWFQRLSENLGTGSTSGTFTALDFTSSNLTSIVTRNHNDLASIQGGESSQYYHLTDNEHSGLTAVNTITNADSPLTATSTHGTILCDATSGSITINLPATSGITGRRFTIKKIDASVNTITIDGNASETIDGATTKVLSAQWAHVTITNDGSNWFIIGE